MNQLNRYHDLTQFKQDVTNFLEKYEVENNLILGILTSITEIPLFMATVTRENKIVLVMLQTHPVQVILSKHLIFEQDDIKKLAQGLVLEYPDIPGLIGEKQLTVELAKHIEFFKGVQSKVKMNWNK